MSDFISRRSFLKGGMTGAAGLAALGMLSGCSGSSQAAASGSAAGAATENTASAALFNAGTYTSIQSSSFASVEVSCTFSETALTDVSYKVLHAADADYFTLLASPMEQYCQSIVANGKADGVDGVSGATLCTNAIRSGVNACTAQALGLPAAPALVNPQEDGFDSFEGDCAEVFSPVQLGTMTLPNRIIKSAAVRGRTAPAATSSPRPTGTAPWRKTAFR